MIGDNIIVNIVKVSAGKIKLGITAPPEISIKREEDPQKFSARARERAVIESHHGKAMKVGGQDYQKQAAKAALI